MAQTLSQSIVLNSMQQQKNSKILKQESPPTMSCASWSRRRFLGTSLRAAGAASLVSVNSAYSTIQLRTSPTTTKRKKVALIITEVRKMSHGQHFLDRFLEGYGWEGRHHHPAFEVAGLYVDQFPKGDLSHDRVERFKVPLFPTVEEAVTLGGSKLAVDGVVLVLGHGN